MDEHKGPLLVPWLWFLIDFRWRREFCSGSLSCWSPKLSTKKYSQPESRELFYLWEGLGLWAWETASQYLLENCSQVISIKEFIFYDITKETVLLTINIYAQIYVYISFLLWLLTYYNESLKNFLVCNELILLLFFCFKVSLNLKLLAIQYRSYPSKLNVT